jgi:hypothetical protein
MQEAGVDAIARYRCITSMDLLRKRGPVLGLQNA